MHFPPDSLCSSLLSKSDLIAGLSLRFLTDLQVDNLLGSFGVGNFDMKMTEFGYRETVAVYRKAFFAAMN